MHDFRQSLINSTLNRVLKRLHYPLEVMLTCVRWYVAYPLSLRHVEEMMQERGVFVDHSSVHRWAIKKSPALAAVFRKRKRPVGSSWWMDETYIKVAGKWKYLYRAVDRAFYPVVLMVVASYYALFAIFADSLTVLIHEMVPIAISIGLAVVGFKVSPWFVVAGLFGHAVFDFSHGTFIENSRVPAWWPGFCLCYDATAAVYLAIAISCLKPRPARLTVDNQLVTRDAG